MSDEATVASEPSLTARDLWKEMLTVIEASTKDERKFSEKSNLAAGRRLRESVRKLRKVAAVFLKQSLAESKATPPKKDRKKT